jgi:hypothetical protein
MSNLLRRALIADLAFSAVAALGLGALAGLLAELLALPEALVRGTGVVLIPWCAILILLLAGKLPVAFGAGFVIAANVLWVVASIALLFTGWVAPNAPGIAFVVVQALAVAAFAAAQFIGLGRAASRVTV